MHILVINDDGPPDPSNSPYVYALVQALHEAGHVVSVCLPHVQRSWIGKAHFIGQRVTPTYYQPGAGPCGEGGIFSETPQAKRSSDRSTSSDNVALAEWVLVDGTPATCAQLGLHHLFKYRGPVDLVLSGPNFGRNTTALYALSSGTLGGALEAAACGARAVGLSYAYDRPRADTAEVVMAASRHSVRVVEHLCNNWGDGVDLYSVNVPVRPGVENEKVVVTFMVQNRWAPGESCFRGADAPGAAVGNVVEEKDKPLEDKTAREGPTESQETSNNSVYQHRYYEWGPSHQSVRATVADSADGSDGKALNNGWTSVTPLKAAFWEVPAHPMGEMMLTSSSQSKYSVSPAPKLLAHIAYEDAYVQPLVLSALAEALPASSYTLLPSALDDSSIVSLTQPYLQITPYEALSHESLLVHSNTYFANAYTIRKALIRKHHLASTVASWRSKRPEDVLATHLPLTLAFELDYAEFLDEALVECYELHEAWNRNADKAAAEREWWILKPGMSDRGQGIRLFSSEEELQAIFDKWEAANPDSDEENEEDAQQDTRQEEDDHHNSNGLMASQLRHFVVQPYIAPLLLPDQSSQGGRKFHLRSYVLAVGALRVFVHAEPLALFAASPYTSPGSTSVTKSPSPPDYPHQTDQSTEDDTEEPKVPEIDMRPHLTNTCLQQTLSSMSSNTQVQHDGPVSLFSMLPLALEQREQILHTIQSCTASLFRAAAATPAHFQPLPNAFELFGVDWLVDEHATPWLLEVNAFPDFGQSGDVGWGVVRDVWMAAAKIVLGEEGVLDSPLLGKDAGKDGEDGISGEDKGGGTPSGFVKVLDIDLGRR